MPEINYVNPKINNIDKQKISIRVSLNGFSFIVRASENNTCLQFKCINFNNLMLIDELIRKVEQIVTDEPAFNKSYTEASLVYLSQKATLVPEEFFNEKYLKKYFEFSQNLDELDEIHYNFISAIKAYNVFSIPNYLTGIFYPLLPNVRFYHQATQLINFGLSEESDLTTRAIVGLNQNYFDLELIENNQLLLSNSFQFSNSMDFIYFFLYSCTQLKIDLSSLTVSFMGHSAKGKEIKNELAKHVKNIAFPVFDTSVLSRNIRNTDAVKYYNLFLPI